MAFRTELGTLRSELAKHENSLKTQSSALDRFRKILINHRRAARLAEERQRVLECVLGKPIVFVARTMTLIERRKVSDESTKKIAVRKAATVLEPSFVNMLHFAEVHPRGAIGFLEEKTSGKINLLPETKDWFQRFAKRSLLKPVAAENIEETVRNYQEARNHVALFRRYSKWLVQARAKHEQVKTEVGAFNSSLSALDSEAEEMRGSVEKAVGELSWAKERLDGIEKRRVRNAALLVALGVGLYTLGAMRVPFKWVPQQYHDLANRIIHFQTRAKPVEVGEKPKIGELIPLPVQETRPPAEVATGLQKAFEVEIPTKAAALRRPAEKPRPEKPLEKPVKAAVLKEWEGDVEWATRLNKRVREKGVGLDVFADAYLKSLKRAKPGSKEHEKAVKELNLLEKELSKIKKK
jgi:outer membrane murein-binding lipoprotein Lpp